MRSGALLIGTGPLAALYNDRDPGHAACRDVMDSIPFGKAYTCWPVITEAACLLRKHPRQRDDLLRSVSAGHLLILRLRERDLAADRWATLINKRGWQVAPDDSAAPDR